MKYIKLFELSCCGFLIHRVAVNAKFTQKITRNLLMFFFSNSSFIDKYIYFLIIKTQYQET